MNIWEKEINDYEDNKLYIGQRIQESRLAKKMRGADLGAYLGISANQVFRIERGEANCDVGKLFMICQCLEMSADYILFGEQKEKNEITDEQKRAIDNLIRAFG